MRGTIALILGIAAVAVLLVIVLVSRGPDYESALREGIKADKVSEVLIISRDAGAYFLTRERNPTDFDSVLRALTEDTRKVEPLDIEFPLIFIVTTYDGQHQTLRGEFTATDDGGTQVYLAEGVASPLLASVLRDLEEQGTTKEIERIEMPWQYLESVDSVGAQIPGLRDRMLVDRKLRNRMDDLCVKADLRFVPPFWETVVPESVLLADAEVSSAQVLIFRFTHDIELNTYVPVWDDGKLEMVRRSLKGSALALEMPDESRLPPDSPYVLTLSLLNKEEGGNMWYAFASPDEYSDVVRQALVSFREVLSGEEQKTEAPSSP